MYVSQLPYTVAGADNQNFGAVMSVSEDLLCSFELLKPLDGAALKKEMTKSKRKRQVGFGPPSG
jgi:serine/threonine-protein phosphatase PP1 catalytic subunit